MRSVVVDFVRKRAADKRGGDHERVELTTGVVNSTPAGEDEILRVHEAVEQFGAVNPRAVEVVEIAEALGVAERTVRRDWEKARLLLAEALQR